MPISTNFSYRIQSDFNVSASLGQLQNLFEHESIKFEVGLDYIKSTSTPFAFFGFDFRKFSRMNWVGINPFNYITSIEIRIKPHKPNKCILEIAINQRRAIFIFSFWALLILQISSSQLPDYVLATYIFLTGTILTYFYVFKLNVQGLIKKEIKRVIQA